MKIVTKAFWKSFELDVFDSVYDPSEDSFLLADNLLRMKNKSFLDVGCGSGIQSISAASKGASTITLIDVNQIALQNAQQNLKKYFPAIPVKSIQSNLFEKMKKEKFDVIAFNPPYVPSEGKPDVRLDGGKTGRDVLDLFLEQADRFLNEKGVIFFLQSSVNGEKQTVRKWGKKFKLQKVVEQTIFFEKLSVWKASPKNGLSFKN